VNARAVLRRQPSARRFLLRLFSPIPFTWLYIRIPAWMLEPSLEAVLEQAERYAYESIKRRLEEDPPAAMEEAPGE
jgi:trans-aconitate methyltransferase